MLRITRLKRSRPNVHLMLEGRLVGPWVAELRRSVLAARRNEGVIHLDLSAVQFVDGEGLALLRRLMDEGAVLCGESPFVRELLKTGPD